MLFIMKLYEEISIHAPRGGSDSKDAQIFCFSLARGKDFL